MGFRYWIALPLLVLLYLTLPAQRYLATLHHFGVEDGLSHRDIYCIHQDHQGFLWFGTKHGLNQFDGYQFTTYTKENHSLASNTIHYILEDAFHRLWLFEGDNWFYKSPHIKLSIFDPTKQEVIPLSQIEGLRELVVPRGLTGFVQSASYTIYMSSEKALWAYRKDGLFKYDIDFHAPIEVQYYDEKGYLWGVSDKQEFIQMDTLGQILARFPSGNFISEEDRVKVLGTNERGNILFSVYYNGTTERSEKNYSLFELSSAGNIQAIDLPFSKEEKFSLDWGGEIVYQQNKHQFWYKGIPQLFSFNRSHITYDFAEEFEALSQAQVHQIFFFNSQRIFLTSNNGFFQLDLVSNPFDRIAFRPASQFQARDWISCRGMAEINGKLFINSYKGVFTYNFKQRQLHKTPYVPTTHQGEPDLIFFDPLAILAGKDGSIWYGEERLIKQDTTGKLTIYASQSNNSPEIWSLFEDSNERIWLGTNSGLMYIKTNQKDAYLYKAQFNEQIANARIWAFIPNQAAEGCYLASSNGLFEFLPFQQEIHALESQSPLSHLLSTDIRHAHLGENNQLWLATYGNGLIHWDQTKDEIFQYTTADGLPNNNLYSVYADNSGQLWISSDYGIIKFDPYTSKSIGYFPEDGITHQEFNSISHYQASNGYLYFGGLNGVTAFHPDSLPDREPKGYAKLQITHYEQFVNKNDSVFDLTQDLQLNKEITLNPGDRFFEIEFALLVYDDPQLIQYAYKIEGLHNNWQSLTQRKIQVSGLPYGTYTLKIRGKGANGQFSSEELALPIRVKKPFYATWGFIIALILFIICVTLFLFWRRTLAFKERQHKLERLVTDRTDEIRAAKLQLETQNQVLVKQANELQELDTLKSQFFANISHELRTPLSLLLGPISSVLASPNITNQDFTLLKLAQNNGNKLLQMINDILELTKFEKSQLQLHEVEVALYPFVRRIMAHFEYEAQQKKIEFLLSFQFPNHLFIKIDEKKLEVIIRNLLANAFKFTPSNGKIELEISAVKGAIQISVQDTGIGISKEELPFVFDRFFQSKNSLQGGTGIGLALCKTYTELMGGRIEVDSQLNSGSLFRLTLPKKEVISSPSLPPESPKPQQWEAALMPAASQAISNKPHILFVEDNIQVQQYVKMILEDIYDVQTAFHGKEALDILDQHAANIHLIISDLMMPVMDGFGLLEELKKQEKFQTIPVIMLTARADQASKLKALRIGVDDFLAKPFEGAELKARMANLLENVRNRKLVEANESDIDTEKKQSSQLSKQDLKWLSVVENKVLERIQDFSLNTQALADDMALSRTQFYRKMKKCTGLSPSEYLQTVRFRAARDLLENQEVGSVKAAAYSVGIQHLGKFSGEFKKRFGKLPSQYLN